MMESRTDLERRRLERQREKEQALIYLNENRGQAECEKVLNEACRVKPDDFYGFLARSFAKLAQEPVVTAVESVACVDGKTSNVEVHCVLHGIQQVIGSSVCPPPPPPEPIAEKSTSSFGKRNKSRPSSEVAVDRPPTPAVTPEAAAEVIAKAAKVLMGKPLTSLEDLDEQMEDIGAEIGNKRATMAVSLALAQSISQLRKEPLATIVSKNKERDLICPIVMSKVLSGGRHANGKLKVRQFYVMPSKEVDCQKGLQYILRFHASLGNVLSLKSGPSSRATLPDGSYAPNLDRIEQALDLMQDALTAADLEWDTHLILGVNIDAETCFNTEKNKYELTVGQLKSSDDLINFYADLIAQKPHIQLLEDPLAKSDVAGWSKLRERLNEKCTLLCSYEMTVPSLPSQGEGETETEPQEDIQPVVRSYNWNEFQTVSHLSRTFSRSATDEKIALGFSDLEDIGCLVDLAIGLGSAYVKLPGPANGFFATQYNRVTEILVSAISDESDN